MNRADRNLWDDDDAFLPATPVPPPWSRRTWATAVLIAAAVVWALWRWCA